MSKSITSGQVRLIRIIAAAVCLAFVFSPATAQQTTATPPQAPERVFIANAGGDFGRGEVEDVGGGAERAYSEFFAKMKEWGRYEIVANPARADWVFEVSVRNDPECVEYPDPGRRKEEDPPPVTRTENHYRIIVLMMDRKSMGVRKRFAERLVCTNLFSSPDKNFDGTVAALIDDVRDEVGDPALKPTPATHSGPPSPAPPEISQAQKVFIHNITVSEDTGERYSGGGAQVYDQLAAAIKSWGRYELVSDRSEADLVFEIEFSAPRLCTGLTDPHFELVIVDEKTDVALWGLSNRVGRALRAGTARRNFAKAMLELVGAVREIAERPTWALNASIPATEVVNPPVLMGASAAPSGTSIPVTISTPNEIVKSGSPVKVNVTLTNGSRRDLNFVYPAGDPLTCMIVVRDVNGNTLANSEEGRKLKDEHKAWQGRPLSYSLHPGEIQRRECAVSELYDMTSAGKYFIQVEQLDGNPVQSNTVAVTVRR